MTPLDPIATALVYDDALRWTVASRSDPHVTYVVELGSFDGNGSCACDDHKFQHAAFLTQGRTAEEVVSLGLVKWPNPKRQYQFKVTDALRCAHIVEARDQACSQFIRAISKAQAACRDTSNTP